MNNKRLKKVLKSPRLPLYSSAALLLVAIILLGWTMAIQKSNRILLNARPSSSYAIKQAIHSGDVIISIENVTFEKGQKPFVAPDNKHYAIVDLQVKNISDAPIQILPSNDTYMKNIAGDVSYLTPYLIEQPFRAGELAPGETIHGELSYLIDESGMVKLFIDAKWSGIAVPILLQENEV